MKCTDGTLCSYSPERCGTCDRQSNLPQVIAYMEKGEMEKMPLRKNKSCETCGRNAYCVNRHNPPHNCTNRQPVPTSDTVLTDTLISRLNKMPEMHGDYQLDPFLAQDLMNFIRGSQAQDAHTRSEIAKELKAINKECVGMPARVMELIHRLERK